MRYRESSTESSLATPSLTRIAGGIPTYLMVLRSPKKAFPPLYSQTKPAKSYPHERANSSASLFSSAVYPALPIFITQPIQRQRYKLTTNNTTTYPPPRSIQLDKPGKFKRSILDNPEMLQLRGILVYPHGDNYIVIGGNMRLRAMIE